MDGGCGDHECVHGMVGDLLSFLTFVYSLYLTLLNLLNALVCTNIQPLCSLIVFVKSPCNTIIIFLYTFNLFINNIIVTLLDT